MINEKGGMSVVDNGGAVAIKGFNYQKASIILVMIHNFEKDNFKVIPESHEDFEIYIEEKVYYIQVKGTAKLSIKNMMKREKDKPSIIEKNLTPGNDNDKRKIFLWDLAATTKKEIVSKKGTFISPLYGFSENQKLEVSNTLKLDKRNQTRLNNQYIYITPFSNNLNLALTMLKGEMVNKDLVVTNERAKMVLGELSLEIDQKSEIPVIDESEIDLKAKEIGGNYLKTLFLTIKQKESFDDVLNKLPYNSIMTAKIKREKIRIPLLYKSVKERVKEAVDLDLLISKTDEEAVQYLLNLLNEITPEIEKRELSIALAIECFCELGELDL